MALLLSVIKKANWFNVSIHLVWPKVITLHNNRLNNKVPLHPILSKVLPNEERRQKLRRICPVSHSVEQYETKILKEINKLDKYRK